jgi:hypothetical protein
MEIRNQIPTLATNTSSSGNSPSQSSVVSAPSIVLAGDKGPAVIETPTELKVPSKAMGSWEQYQPPAKGGAGPELGSANLRKDVAARVNRSSVILDRVSDFLKVPEIFENQIRSQVAIAGEKNISKDSPARIAGSRVRAQDEGRGQERKAATQDQEFVDGKSSKASALAMSPASRGTISSGKNQKRGIASQRSEDDLHQKNTNQDEEFKKLKAALEGKPRDVEDRLRSAKFRQLLIKHRVQVKDLGGLVIGSEKPQIRFEYSPRLQRFQQVSSEQP